MPVYGCVGLFIMFGGVYRPEVEPSSESRVCTCRHLLSLGSLDLFDTRAKGLAHIYIYVCICVCARCMYLWTGDVREFAIHVYAEI